ncbi:MAG: hypothetical protein ABJP48_04700 [Erythrobacter sp.]
MSWMIGGRRPWTIRLFAIAFLSAAAIDYVQGLSAISTLQMAYTQQFPWFDWTRDWAIVALSAMFSIAAIPVAMILMRAIRIARWLVTVFSIFKLLSLPQMIMEWVSLPHVSLLHLASPLLTLVAVVLLFTPSANRWFAQKKGSGLAVFD